MVVKHRDVKVREEVLEVGQPRPLVGIWTSTATGRADTALILLNAGLMHRVGTCRASVTLARRVATEVGLPSVRFDFAGLGDSEPRRANVDFDRAAVAEVKEMMDYLQRTRNLKHFILYGLCSGAHIATVTAAEDDRVRGAIQLDGFCYPTFRSYLRYYMVRTFAPAAWRMRMRRWLRRRGQSHIALTAARADFEVPQFVDDPGRRMVAGRLRQLLARGSLLHCVFTGFDPDYAYRDQFRHCFKDVSFADQLSLDYYPHASHIFTEPEDRAAMLDGVVSWIAATQRKMAARSQSQPTSHTHDVFAVERD